jgi:hypothetical protein
MASLTRKARAVKVTVRKSVRKGDKVKTVEWVLETMTKTTTAHLLRFGRGNAKLKDPAILTFSLPAGWSCPGAAFCLSLADRISSKVKDGPKTSFRCYAATMEARHTSVRNCRWHNASLLKSCSSKDEMTALILDSLSSFAGVVRTPEAAAARWRKAERVFCARLLNEQVLLLEADGHHEAAVAVRLVVRLLGDLDGE